MRLARFERAVVQGEAVAGEKSCGTCRHGWRNNLRLVDYRGCPFEDCRGKSGKTYPKVSATRT